MSLELINTLGSFSTYFFPLLMDPSNIQKQTNKYGEALENRDLPEQLHHLVKRVIKYIDLIRDGIGTLCYTSNLLSHIAPNVSIPGATMIQPFLSPLAALHNAACLISETIGLARDGYFRLKFCGSKEENVASVTEAFNKAFPHQGESRSAWSHKKLQRYVGKTCATKIQEAQKTGTLTQEHFDYMSRQNIKRGFLHIVGIIAFSCLLSSYFLSLSSPLGFALFVVGFVLFTGRLTLSKGWLESETWKYSFEPMKQRVQAITKKMTLAHMRMHFVKAHIKIASVLAKSNKSLVVNT